MLSELRRGNDTKPGRKMYELTPGAQPSCVDVVKSWVSSVKTAPSSGSRASCLNDASDSSNYNETYFTWNDATLSSMLCAAARN